MVLWLILFLIFLVIVWILLTIRDYPRLREVYLLCVSKDKWMTTREIREEVGKKLHGNPSIPEVHIILHSLEKHGFVIRRESEINLEQRGGRKTAEYLRTNKKVDD